MKQVMSIFVGCLQTCVKRFCSEILCFSPVQDLESAISSL